MMFTSLAQFYSSQQWRDFRKRLIIERMAEDGLVYCEYSHEPIINEYEIIAHHKIYLTEQNMNDYSISLNPDNIMLVSHASHNIIHKRFEWKKSQWQRKVYVVFGAPCSGKSSFVRNNMSAGDMVLDLDEIWKAISLQEPHVYCDNLKPIVFGVRQYLMEQIKMRAGQWDVAWLLSTEALPIEQERLCERLGGEAIYIDTDQATCLQRLHENPSGRDVILFEKIIRDYFSKKELYS